MTTSLDDELRIVCWNLETNGLPKKGGADRRPVALTVLAGLRPHIVLRQELTGAHENGARTLYEEASHLGLVPFMTPPTSDWPHPAGVLFDPGVFETVAYYEHAGTVWPLMCNPVLRLRGTDRPIPVSVASVHFSTADPLRRAGEARRLIVLAEQQAALFGGDFNSYPCRDPFPLPEWDTIADAGHRERRSSIDHDGRRVADTGPDDLLTRQGLFTELGQYAAVELDQPRALTPTASLWRADQGAPQRIDRMYATSNVAAALTRLDVIDTDEVRAASDHALLLATFSLTGLRKALTLAV
ncbi:endonuclease/exonuclease/phosphatase family protein [Streptomyces sp. MP131-18]|uniref:endonuclease/exonuclease/phosphatase family protein n=1 Tax=Streptomyces sp. MP131-18 TaxID=1857892 RepID=UPI0009D42076|nr:endonuclease/exonuclease/phosphatase family protein [Streptomyces sp. MP131-18]ONK13196.1 Endonuclease/Exonuclease/phosphatase family protein [Streptomyces sp. MP131-18]